MLSLLASLPVGEIAALRVSDLIDVQGQVREQLRLEAAMTKGGHARVVFLSNRLRRETNAIAMMLPFRRIVRDASS